MKLYHVYEFILIKLIIKWMKVKQDNKSYKMIISEIFSLGCRKRKKTFLKSDQTLIDYKDNEYK